MMTTPLQAVLILSGPGGVGKGTIVDALLDDQTPPHQLGVAVSATTRKARAGEENGKHYWFISHQSFEAMIASDEFLEWAPFGDNLYGTPWSSITQAKVPILILEIDCQGAEQVMGHPERLGDIPLVTIFIAPPSWDELEQRLRKRAADTEQQIAHRLSVGKHEMSLAAHYDHVVVNDTLETSVQAIQAIVQQVRDSVQSC